jgi:hypothetical protein
MSILHPPTTNIRQFHYFDGKLVGEMSSTNGFGRVYDDACDEGLTIESNRTGRQVVYAVDSEIVRDGEIVAWELIPARIEERRSVPSVTIFND